jgi:hypothetical protein
LVEIVCGSNLIFISRDHNLPHIWYGSRPGLHGAKWKPKGVIKSYEEDPDADGGYGERSRNLMHDRYFYWPTSTRIDVFLLKFRLFSDAPSGVSSLYKKVYDDIISEDIGRFDKYIFMWLERLREENIGTDIDRQYLKRAEGGIGGNDNRKNRQIRFFNSIEDKTTFRKFGEITFRAEPSDDASCKWDIDELVEFGNKFKEIIESYVASHSIDFYVAVEI